jgi:O-acetylhomoserine (thiol)-lyase
MSSTPAEAVVSNVPGAEETPREYGIETLAVHAGARPDPTTGARSTPIYQTTSFVFDDADHAASLFNLQTFGYIYSRMTNPTVSVLEERVAALEGGRGAVAAATGHAAQFLVAVTLMRHGDEFISSRNLYGGSITQFGVSFARLGWKCHFVDPTDPESFRAAMTDKVKFIFLEGLANPGGIVIDIEKVAEIAREFGVPLVVDNTLASPYLCRPFEWGADLVVHSTTKFIGGHGNTMGGIIVESGRFDWRQNDKFPGLAEPDPAYHGLVFAETFGDFGFTMKVRAVALRDYGPTLYPTAAWNLLQGVETLPLRPQGDLGLVFGPQVEPVLRPRPEVHAQGGGLGADLRPQGRLRLRARGGRRGRHVLASRQYRRHPQPDPAPGLDHPPPAHRGAADRRRRRPRRGPPVGRNREHRRHHRRPRPGAGRGVSAQ